MKRFLGRFNRTERRVPAPRFTLVPANPHAATAVTGKPIEHKAQPPVPDTLQSIRSQSYPKVTFSRRYVAIAGSVFGAIWLSVAIELALGADAGAISKDGDFQFQLKARDFTAISGLNATYAATARKHLVAEGILTENYQRGRLNTYTLHLDTLATRLNEPRRRHGRRPNPEQVPATPALPSMPNLWSQRA